MGVWFLVFASALAAEAPVARERGLWFWAKPASPLGAVNVLGDAPREAEALATFERWQVRRLYGSYATLPVDAPDRLAAWNRRLHAQGIHSASLFSDGGALTAAGRAAFLRQIDERVLAFNASQSDPAARFGGLALDVEPHALSRWKTATPAEKRALLEDLLTTCTALRAHLDAHGGGMLPVAAALAYWLDRLPTEGGSVGWTSAADRDAWFARLGRVVAQISLMAYERPAPAAILDATAWERKHFSGRVVTALRARLGVEWRTLADLQRVLPEVEAGSPPGIDLENYELLRLAETAK
jgi:hypothetical protein